MEKVTKEGFNIIGIAIRTTNENQQASKDIPQLWNKFMEAGILEMIPNKIDTTVYGIYTDYEGDYTKPYTAIIGCKVSNIESIPDGLIVKTIAPTTYTKFTAKGALKDNVVFDKWVAIWDLDLDRSYTSDFEVYGEKAMDMNNAEVDIFIAVEK